MLAISGVLVCDRHRFAVLRGKSIFDIDFAGGSSVQFRLDQPTPADKIRQIVKSQMMFNGEEVPYTVNGVSMEGIPADTVYKVDSSFEKVEELKAAVAKAFANDSLGRAGDLQRLDHPTGKAQIDSGSRLRGAIRFEWCDVNRRRAQQDTRRVDGETSSAESRQDPGPVNSSAIVELGIEGGSGGGASINAITLTQALVAAAEEVNVPLTERSDPVDSRLARARRIGIPIRRCRSRNGKSICRFRRSKPTW